MRVWIGSVVLFVKFWACRSQDMVASLLIVVIVRVCMSGLVWVMMLYSTGSCNWSGFLMVYVSLGWNGVLNP